MSHLCPATNTFSSIFLIYMDGIGICFKMAVLLLCYKDRPLVLSITQSQWQAKIVASRNDEAHHYSWVGRTASFIICKQSSDRSKPISREILVYIVPKRVKLLSFTRLRMWLSKEFNISKTYLTSSVVEQKIWKPSHYKNSKCWLKYNWPLFKGRADRKRKNSWGSKAMR